MSIICNDCGATTKRWATLVLKTHEEWLCTACFVWRIEMQAAFRARIANMPHTNLVIQS